MLYIEKYQLLKQACKLDSEIFMISDSRVEIHHLPFVSDSVDLLPAKNYYTCAKHGLSFEEHISVRDAELAALYPEDLRHDDIDIPENKEFYYTIFKKAGPQKAEGIVLLFHGLNEKYWDKYMPWAERLVCQTGKMVVMLPIAFHMNRSPASWSSPRMMNAVTKTRHNLLRSLDNSSFANAAISARIQAIPQRFFWSGLETFYDVVKLIKSIRSGEHPLINSDATIDLFSYSIGSFLSEILLMSNPSGFFTDSKLFIFCGGPTLDRMQPNSKFILDSDATIALYSFYTERLDKELTYDKRMSHYFSQDHSAGVYFKSMLNYQKGKAVREQRFSEISSQIKSIALRKDEVIPPNEVVNTLKGDFREIPIHVDILDFPFMYDHINPFPVNANLALDVDVAFNHVFEIASQFLQ
ncbi:MAG: DUF6051 family protein [Ignavibacteria bacterium]|nr:DUF6051 family protein [Ignavibacteria bacterium]